MMKGEKDRERTRAKERERESEDVTHTTGDGGSRGGEFVSEFVSDEQRE